MALRNGLYLVKFRTPLSAGSGVAFLSDGELHGGDNLMAYVGKFSEADGKMQADVRIFRHSSPPGARPILGTNSATLKLVGTVSGDTADLTGSAPEAPQVELSISLSPLNEGS